MNKKKLHISNIITILLLLVIMLNIVKNPKQSISSAKEGLDIWFNLLIPSLFPFIFISDLLVSIGFVNIFAKYLEPIMKPIFNVSGIGIFPFSMSIMSGYPVGAKLTSNLRNMGLISKTVGNRLISFSSTSGPLFILGTVLIGMLKAPKLSGLMIIPHYLGAITLGVIFRFYKKNEEVNPIENSSSNLETEISTLQNKNKSIGNIISKSIKDSTDSIIVVGGFVIVYSVVIDILILSSTFNSFITILSQLTAIDAYTLKGLTAGIIEITKGCSIISNLDIELINKIILINFIIGWGGFSIHSQAISFIGNTDISTKIYLVSKAFHGFLSAIFTYLIYIFIYKGQLSTTFYTPPIYTHMPKFNSWLMILTSSTKIAISLTIFLLLLSIFVREVRKEA